MEKLKLILSKIKIYTVIAFFLFSFFCIKAYFFEYFRIQPFCHISLKEYYPSDGTNSKIIQALDYLRDINPENYQYMCLNIDSIEAKFCDLKHLLSKPEESWHQKDGCYVKGGYTLYLSPDYIKKSSVTDLSKKIDYLTQKEKKFFENK